MLRRLVVSSGQVDRGEGIQRRDNGLASTSHSWCFLEEEEQEEEEKKKNKTA